MPKPRPTRYSLRLSSSARVSREDYEKKASAAYGDKIRAGVKECQDKVDSIERIAQMEAKKAVLALKQEMVSASFDKARDMIVGLPKEQYTAFLAKLAAQAAVTGDEEVLLNGRDRDTVGPAAVKAANETLGAGRLTLAADAGNFAGGLILRRGNIEVNCTVELLVELCRADMSASLPASSLIDGEYDPQIGRERFVK